MTERDGAAVLMLGAGESIFGRYNVLKLAGVTSIYICELVHFKEYSCSARVAEEATEEIKNPAYGTAPPAGEVAPHSAVSQPRVLKPKTQRLLRQKRWQMGQLWLPSC